MKNKDLKTFRLKIYDDLNIWFSYSSRSKVLFTRWHRNHSCLIDLLNYLKPFGCTVIFNSDIVIISPFNLTI